MNCKLQRLIRWALPLLLACFAVQAGHAQYVIDSLSGDVTQHEADAFINTISAVTIPTSEWSYNGNNTLHNYLADLAGGQQLRAMNRLYRITRDNPSLNTEQMQLMNLAITWTEAWLTHRNDLPLGDHRVMWTGKVDAIWPPDAPTTTCPTSAASEVGDTVGHMAETAYNIVSTPSIWSQTVPDGNPNGYGVTYLDRARTYESMLEFTMDEYYNANFLNATTAFIQHPSSSAYTTLGCNSNVNSWNRGMMFLHAYQILGQIHELLGDNPAKASLYKQVTVNWVDLFVKNAQPITAPDGTAVYDWGYGNFGDETGHLTQESTGHAQYDIWGLTYAWRAGYYSAITSQNMSTYADTLVHETMVSPGVWASFIDRCCNTNTNNYLFPGHLFLTPFNSSLYQLGANADLRSGRQPGSADITMSILWAKHWNFTHALPAGLSDSDIGNPMLVGDGSAAYGTFKIKAGGSGIDGASDQFNYLSQSTGDGTLVARVASQQNTASGAKAGVMFRASASANDAYVAVSLTPANGAVMQYRSSAGATATQTASTPGLAAPYWVKLVRSGSTFTGYTSPDGNTWTQLGQATMSISSPALAGLASTSNNDASLNTSTFDNFSLNVTPDFSVSATPASQTVIQGDSTSYIVSVTPSNGFNGTVDLSVSGLPSGVSCSSGSISGGSGSATLSCTTSSSTPANTYTLTITGTSGSLSHTASVALTVNPPPDFSLSASPSSQTVTAGNGTSYTATVTPTNGFTGTVNLSVSGAPSGASCSSGSVSGGSGSATLSCTTSTSTPANTYTLTITGTSGSLSHSANVNLTVNPPPDFSLNASPSSQTVTAGNGTSYTATVTPANGFNGTVALSVSGLPSGANCSSGSISGGSGSATLSCTTSTSTPAGTYALTITGTSGALPHTANVSLTVNAPPPPDFTLTASPSSQTVTAGNGTSYTATVTSANGFNGTVALSVSGAPSGASCSAGSVSGGSGSATLSCTTSTSTPANTYTLTITGTSGSLSHTANVNLTVNPPPPPDFTLTASPSSQTVTAGKGTSYTATVAPKNGFTGTVSLSASGLPSGASCTSGSVSGGSGSATLSCTTSNSTPANTYTLTITGTSGSLSHTATVRLVVTSPITCSTATATGMWNDAAFPSHSGTFTASFDATPSIGTQSSAVGISKGAQTAYTGFANIVAFAITGIIQVRSGSGYVNSPIHYSAGVSYHFRLVINVSTHTYSVFVTPAGGTEQTVGTGFMFRTEQNTVTSLDHWGSIVNSTSSGTLKVCNFMTQ